MTRHSVSRRRWQFSTSTLTRRLKKILPVSLVLLIASVAVLASISFVTKWGSTGTGDGQFLTPTGIAVDTSGNVYVCEGGQRVQKFNNSGVFQFKFGSGGSLPGQFVNPNGIAVDSAGNIYVSDSTDPVERVQKFNSAGVYQGVIGGPYVGPSGVAIDSADNIYVLDGNGQRVYKFDSTGAPLLNWGGSGAGNGQFNFPQGIAVDASGNVYVADTVNARIQKFDSSGTFITKWGTAGSGNGEFMSPLGVTADASGNIYVADNLNSRIQRFDSAGTFIEAFGTSGSGDGQFNGPEDLAADSSGNIFVADSGQDRIQKLTTTAPSVVANAGPDQTVECGGTTTSVLLDGTASTGSGTLTYTWKEGATPLGTGATLATSLSTGTHTITLTVSSSGGGSDDDEVIISIVDTQAPIITLNGVNPMTVECHTSFTDPGATANDGCAGSFAATASGSVNANAPGSYTITYNATDPAGNPAAPVTRTVNVVDSTAPVITVNGNSPTLWPPNHKYWTFSVTDFVIAATDSCNTSLGVGNVVISQVTSDELEDSGGDGHTLNDIVIAPDCKSVQLRAERDGGGDGRVYTITFKVADASGNVGTATATVTVPKSQANGAAVDSGVHYTVAGSCP